MSHKKNVEKQRERNLSLSESRLNFLGAAAYRTISSFVKYLNSSRLLTW